VIDKSMRDLIEHDMRGPIAVIIGYAELLKMRNDEATRLEAADRLIEAANRLGEQLDELLAELERLSTRPPG
jgi:signal transduction histidine kinase